MGFSSQDDKYMERALGLAKRAQNPSPNPYVGAVLVKNGRKVGEGYHRCAGESHAEVNAIRSAGAKARSSTLYINLEPCIHHGRTPPCTEAIIKAGAKRVVLGMKDPNPLVNGRGIKALRSAGIEVKCGLRRDEARRLNEFYLKCITEKTPFVILKSAVSLDGKIATIRGESRWISSDASRRYARKLRGRLDAVLVGINTVLSDDPGLDAASKSPYKIVVDTKLRIPLKAKVLRNPGRVIVATVPGAPCKKADVLRRLGVQVLRIRKRNGKIDLKILMKELAKIEISSVLIEGGGEINASAIESGIVDKVLFFIAPKIIGGRNAKTAVEGEGIKRIARAVKLRDVSVKEMGGDVMVEGYL